MKEKLSAAMGTTGVIVWYIISVVYCLAPLFILNFPFWVDIILIFVMMSIPIFGEIVRFALFVWAFVVAISQPIGIISIVFFVCAVIYMVTTLIPFVGALFSND